MPHRIRATRVEMYGCLLVVAIVIESMWERLAIDRAIMDEIIRKPKKPAIVIQQNNNQEVSVTLEHPLDKLAREIKEKRDGKKEDGDKPNHESK